MSAIASISPIESTRTSPRSDIQQKETVLKRRGRISAELVDIIKVRTLKYVANSTDGVWFSHWSVGAFISRIDQGIVSEMVKPPKGYLRKQVIRRAVNQMFRSDKPLLVHSKRKNKPGDWLHLTDAGRAYLEQMAQHPSTGSVRVVGKGAK